MHYTLRRMKFFLLGSFFIQLSLGVNLVFAQTNSQNVCGANVTEGLNKVLSQIPTFFESLPNSEQWRLCMGLYGNGDYAATGGASFWDIYSLRVGTVTTGEAFDTASYQRHTKDCGDTVQVNIKGKPQCFHGWAVNYAAWGAMNKACERLNPRYNEELAVTTTALWKTYAYAGKGILESERWTRAGFHFSKYGTAYFDGMIQDTLGNEGLDRCKIDESANELNALPMHWGPHNF